MAKTFAYRFLGLGRFPKELVEQFRSEGLLFIDEGIRCSVTYKNFRGGGRISNWKRQWFGGGIILTEKRLVAYRLRTVIIDVTLDDPRIKRIEFSTEEPETLLAAFEADLFQRDWKGRIEYRFRTPFSTPLLEKLNELLR